VRKNFFASVYGVIRFIIQRSGTIAGVPSLLLGALMAVFLAGNAHQGACGLFLLLAGLVLVSRSPTHSTPWMLWILGALLVVLMTTSLLPLQVSIHGWREVIQAGIGIHLPQSFTVSPADTIAWTFFAFFSAAVALHALGSPCTRNQLEFAGLIVVFGCSLYAVLAVISWKSGWHYPFFDQDPDYPAVFGFFPNRNHTAGFLITGAIVALGLLRQATLGKKFLLFLIATTAFLLLVSCLLFFSSSRGGLVFLFLGVLIWVAGLGKRFRPWWLLFLLGFAALTMAVRFATSDTPLLQRFLQPTPKIQKTFGSPGVGERNNPESTKVDARLGIARDTLRMIRDYPLTGTGAGTYASLYPLYARSSLMDKTTALHPESDWLMLASESGIPALLVAFGILLILLRGVPSLAVISGDSWPLKWAFLSAFLAEVLHGFVDVPIHRIELGWWVMILGAIGFAVPKETPETKSASVRAQYVMLLIAGLVMLVAGAMMVRAQWFGGGDVPPFESVNGRDRILMRYAYADNSWYQLDPIFSTSRQLIRRYPLQGDIRQQYGIFLIEEKWDLHEAETLFSQARALQPHNADLAYTQGIILAPADAKGAAMIWKDALKRQLILDELPNSPVRRSTELFSTMLRESASNPALLAEMGELSRVSPEIHAFWLSRPTSTAAEIAEAMKDQTFLKGLGERDQGRLFETWWQRGDKKKVEEFLGVHPEYSRAAIATKAAIAASSGREEEACRSVMDVFKITLPPLPDPAVGIQAAERDLPSEPLAAAKYYLEHGNEVAALRLLSEASSDPANTKEILLLRARMELRVKDWKGLLNHLLQYLHATAQL